MIQIEEISVENIDAFWQAHFAYLVEAEIITDREDKEYFQSDEYRGLIRDHLLRDTDRHHLVWFREGENRVGGASYCTYQSEDGKCFILDYWMFPEYRGRGMGHRCFEALKDYTAKDGAVYYEINCDGREDRMRFWRSNGFVDNGLDEYGVPLLIRKG